MSGLPTSGLPLGALVAHQWWASLIANDDTARCNLLETLNLDQKCIFICTKFRTMIHDRGCNFDRNMKHWVVGPAMHGMHWFSRTLLSCEESPAATTLMQIEITARGSNGWKIEVAPHQRNVQIFGSDVLISKSSQGIFFRA